MTKLQARLFAVLALVCAITVPCLASGQPRTPEEAALVRTAALQQQLGHVARSRGMTVCEAYQRFRGVPPFANALDPWGRPLEFSCAGAGVTIRSAGPDRVMNTADDVVNGGAPAAAPTEVGNPAAVAPKAPVKGKFPSMAVALVVAGLAAAWVLISDAWS